MRERSEYAVTARFAAWAVITLLLFNPNPVLSGVQVSSNPPGQEIHIYRKAIKNCKLGKPVNYKGLTIFPIFGKSHEAFYLTLDQALEQKVLKASDTGVVEEVKLVNKSKQPVLIIDGEEIIGAKQNRIFNSSLLVPPNTSVVAKVSCVEEGRWSNTSQGFKSAGTQLFARARQDNARTVSSNMENGNGQIADQNAVWFRVSQKNKRLGVAKSAPTKAMHVAYESKKDEIETYLKRFKPTDNQTGAMFILGTDIVGMDIFDSTQTFSRIYPKLIKSYTLDAIEHRGVAVNERQLVSLKTDSELFLKNAAQATAKSYKSQGEGRDIRLGGRYVSGGALVARGQMLHAAVFTATNASDEQPRSGIAPPRQRQRTVN